MHALILKEWNKKKIKCTENHTKRRSANKMSQMPIDFNH